MPRQRHETIASSAALHPFLDKTVMLCPTAVKQSRQDSWRERVTQLGGQSVTSDDDNDLEALISRSDIVVTKYRDSRAYSIAIMQGKVVASPDWLKAQAQATVHLDPQSDIRYYPIPRVLRKALSGQAVSITVYSSLRRTYLINLIRLLGGTYRPDLTRGITTLCIAAKAASDKYARAIEWEIPVVNHHYLEDFFFESPEGIDITSDRYAVSQVVDLNDSFEPRPFDDGALIPWLRQARLGDRVSIGDSTEMASMRTSSAMPEDEAEYSQVIIDTDALVGSSVDELQSQTLRRPPPMRDVLEVGPNKISYVLSDTIRADTSATASGSSSSRTAAETGKRARDEEEEAPTNGDDAEEHLLPIKRCRPTQEDVQQAATGVLPQVAVTAEQPKRTATQSPTSTQAEEDAVQDLILEEVPQDQPEEDVTVAVQQEQATLAPSHEHDDRDKTRSLLAMSQEKQQVASPSASPDTLIATPLAPSKKSNKQTPASKTKTKAKGSKPAKGIDPASSPSQSLRTPRSPQRSSPPGSRKRSIATTGYTLTEAEKKSLSAAKIATTDDVSKAGILVASKFGRTPKMLYAIASGTVEIVNSQWIKDAVAHQDFVDIRPKHLLQDEENEKKFGFKLADAMQRSRSHPGKLFEGHTFYLTRNLETEPETLKKIIKAAGGTIAKGNTIDMEDLLEKNYHLISSLKDNKIWAKMLREPEAKGVKVREPEFVVSSVHKQMIEWDKHSIQEPASRKK